MDQRLDSRQLAELVGQRTRSDIEASDPIFQAAAIVEQIVGDANKKMLDEVTKLVTGLADRVATANVLAETNARAKAETIITEAAKWGAEQIRMAGADATSQVLTELRVSLDEIAVKRDEARMWSLWSIGAAAVTVLAVMALVWKSWWPV
jgi:hypothetical protein